MENPPETFCQFSKHDWVFIQCVNDHFSLMKRPHCPEKFACLRIRHIALLAFTIITTFSENLYLFMSNISSLWSKLWRVYYY